MTYNDSIPELLITFLVSCRRSSSYAIYVIGDESTSTSIKSITRMSKFMISKEKKYQALIIPTFYYIFTTGLTITLPIEMLFLLDADMHQHGYSLKTADINKSS